MILRSYRLLQHLSIDIVFGAVILLHFFSKIYNVSVSWPAYVLLGSSIWLIYTLDHLRDSKLAVLGTRERYAFHARNQKALKTMMIIVTVLSTICLFFVSTAIIVSGGILAGFCLIYVLGQSVIAKKGLKELYVAVVYTFGILLVPISLTQQFDLYSFLILLILSFLNLAIFSWFEFTEDKQDSFQSIATQLGQKRSLKLIFGILSVGFAIGFAAINTNSVYPLYMIFVLSIFTLLIFKENWARQKNRYRTIGDAVFILPILFEFL